MVEIRNWKDIEDDYGDTIILGNGASIALDENFKYGSLYEHAKEKNYINEEIVNLFNRFETKDFELILRRLLCAKNVNEILGGNNSKIKDAYDKIKNSLVGVVADIHPECHDIDYDFDTIYQFIKRFKTILSLNYDLFIYWLIMYAKASHSKDGYIIKDCFAIKNGMFDSNWQKYRNPVASNNQGICEVDGKQCPLVFYPHGNLLLTRDYGGSERKVISDSKIKNQLTSGILLKSIKEAWENSSPLFVCEGSAEHKKQTINSSNYLSTVYNEVLPEKKESLVIYGWGLEEQDEHLLEKMKDSGIKQVAVSVYKGNQDYKDYCDNMQKKINRILGYYIKIDFFDSESAGCWNNYCELTNVS